MGYEAKYYRNIEGAKTNEKLMKSYIYIMCVLLLLGCAPLSWRFFEFYRHGKYVEVVLQNDSKVLIEQLSVFANGVVICKEANLLPESQKRCKIAVTLKDNPRVVVHAIFRGNFDADSVDFTAWGGDELLILMAPKNMLVVKKRGAS